jgi:hypothetical protein
MIKTISHIFLCVLVLSMSFNTQHAWAQASYSQNSGTSTVEIAIYLASFVVGLFIMHKKGFFARFRPSNPEELSTQSNQTGSSIPNESEIDKTIDLIQKSRLARKITASLVILSILISLLLFYKISQTSALALRYDDGVKEQLGYWGLGLTVSWLLTSVYGFLHIYGSRQISKRKNMQIKGLVECLSDLEVEISNSDCKETEGSLKSRKVRLESFLRRLEAT